MATRNHAKWARWYVENHSEELEQLLEKKYGMKLNMRENEKIKFVNNILKAYWKAFSATIWSRKSEIYWARHTRGRNKTLLVAVLLLKNERFKRMEYIKKLLNKDESN